MIGKDFEKIQLDIWGLHFLEPNAMIGDIILFIAALYFSSKIKNTNFEHPFLMNWSRFYLLFGLSFLAGGLGHFLYNYMGLWGKYPSWIIGMIATYYLSIAQISLWPNPKQKALFKTGARVLLVIGIVLELFVFVKVDLTIDQSKGLAIPTIISGIGLLFSLLYLGIYYQNQIHQSFKFLWIAVLTLLPNTIIQSQKINLAPWFDRNDFSHVLLLISLFLYWQGIKAFITHYNTTNKP